MNPELACILEHLKSADETKRQAQLDLEEWVDTNLESELLASAVAAALDVEARWRRRSYRAAVARNEAENSKKKRGKR